MEKTPQRTRPNREHMRDATGDARPCRISCAASRGQRISSKALYSTTSAQHGTDATHKMQHTTGAAACSKHTRNRQHAAGIETYEMRRTESGRSAPRECAGPSAGLTGRKGLGAPKCLGGQLLPVRSALGDPSDVVARRLPLSLACGHRRPTDVDRPRCGIRTRLGAREAHALGSCCPPRPRLPASRGPMKPPALSTRSPTAHSSFELFAAVCNALPRV